MSETAVQPQDLVAYRMKSDSRQYLIGKGDVALVNPHAMLEPGKLILFQSHGSDLIFVAEYLRTGKTYLITKSPWPGEKALRHFLRTTTILGVVVEIDAFFGITEIDLEVLHV